MLDNLIFIITTAISTIAAIFALIKNAIAKWKNKVTTLVGQAMIDAEKEQDLTGAEKREYVTQICGKSKTVLKEIERIILLTKVINERGKTATIKEAIAEAIKELTK